MVKIEESKNPEIKDNSNPVVNEQLTEKSKSNPWVFSTIALAVIVIGLLVYNFTGGITGNVSKDTAANNLITFLKSNAPGEVTLKDTSIENGLYKVNIEYQGQTIPLYVTKDGKFMASIQPITSTSNPITGTQTIPKTDKPKVDLYVMSFCPYGNRAENTMVPVYNLLKNKIDFNVHYIVSVNGKNVNSLHGQPEVDENEREACVLDLYGMDAWWKFTIHVNNNCGSDGSCWKDAARTANADTAAILRCLDEKGVGLMSQSADASNKAGASGSPTLIINGAESQAVYKYGDTNAYKDAICSAFTDSPNECSTQLAAVADSGAQGNCAA